MARGMLGDGVLDHTRSQVHANDSGAKVRHLPGEAPVAAGDVQGQLAGLDVQ